MRSKAKSELIKDIVKATRSDGPEVMDVLLDKDEKYLRKLLNVIKGL